MPRRYRIFLDVEAGFDASRVTADWVHRAIQPTLDQYRGRVALHPGDPARRAGQVIREQPSSAHRPLDGCSGVTG